MAAGAASTPKINCLEVAKIEQTKGLAEQNRTVRMTAGNPGNLGISHGDRDGNSCHDDAGENIFGKVFLPISIAAWKTGKASYSHILFWKKYFLLYTKESLQERSKAKVPGEKSWTKNNCHIIINAKLQ